MTNIVISGTGLFHPEDSVSNDELVNSFNTYVSDYNQQHADQIANGELELLKESSSEFIEKASGIKNRYMRSKADVLDPQKMWPYFQERSDDELCEQAEAGVIAAKQAMLKANKSADDIDAVIVSCTHKQRDYPSIAIEIQQALGIEGFAFDMGVACSSATFGIQTAVDSIKAGHARRILMITPEMGYGQVNYRDRDSHFIFGEANTAVLLEREDLCTTDSGYRIIDSSLATQFSNNIRNNRGAFDRSCPEKMYAPDKLFYQQGRKVFKEVTPMVIEKVLSMLAKHGIESTDVKRYWLHQANINMNRVICEKLLGKDFDFLQAPVVLDEFANAAASGSIVALHRYYDGLQAGDYGVLCSFGAGYSIGCIILQKVC
jgi:beta-ketodecanoyl-[acyl-carrier-protein] synthase